MIRGKKSSKSNQDCTRDGMPSARRSDAEIGFGMGEGLLWYPYLATDASGDRRFGLRLSSG